MDNDLTRRGYLSSIALVSVFSGCLQLTSQESETESTPTTAESTQDRVPTSPSTRTQTPSGPPTRTDERTSVVTDEATETETVTNTATEAEEQTPTETDDPTSTEAAEPTETQTTTVPSPEQPKIREVEDNFGNTFTIDGDTGGSVHVEDEIVVSDETMVELCVTDVAKPTDQNVTYSYWFGNSQAEHPDNTSGSARIEDNCHQWDMRRDDYASSWSFSIWIRNEDEIYYQNDSVESDFRVVIYYENLTLADSESDSTDEPGQPKIREIEDNFGHTFSFDGDSGDSVRVDDEIVVSDDTSVELCVTDVAKQDEQTVTYSYWFGNSKADHPDNTAGSARLEDSCHQWDMRRDDYASSWSFSVWIRNEDEIYYQNDSVESDFRVVIYYNNLRLED